MTRTLTAIGLALGLVGTAHAQAQQVTVSLVGKSHAAVRSEIYHAAQSVCGHADQMLDPVDTACIEATYDQAMRQLRATPRAARIAYQLASPPTR